MEEVTGFIGALVIALIVAAVFYYGFNRRGPWGAFWTFLLILFFAAWAGSFWIEPAGPVIWGFAWLPLFFWVFIVALIIGVATGEDRTSSRYDTTRTSETTETEVSETEAGTAAALGIFFWILLALLIVAIIIGLLT